MLLLDVDGVLTDGRIILAGGDPEIKCFDVQDGAGIVLARSMGLKVGIISGRQSAAVERRAKELGVDVLYQGCKDKAEALQEILEQFELGLEQVAYVGDDWADIAIMQTVGLPLAVGNARPEVKAVACHVAHSEGGRGAVRELIEWLLEAQGLKTKALEKYGGAVKTSERLSGKDNEAGP